MRAVRQFATVSGAQAQYSIQAIHIDHGLHPDSAQWAKHCQQVCDHLGVTLHTVRVAIDLNSGDSIEALARAERRRVWQELLPAGAALLLAHHHEDQAETVLHRLFRGAGPTGLSGMAEQCYFGKGQLLRPLLTITKQEIVEFTQSQISCNGNTNVHGIAHWIVDPSNSDSKFERNFIRHEILPKIKQRWPKVAANIARSAALCSEQTQLVRAEAEQLMATVCKSTEVTESSTVCRSTEVTESSTVCRSTEVTESSTVCRSAEVTESFAVPGIAGVAGSAANTLSVSELLKLPVPKISQVLRYWIGLRGLLLPSQQQLQGIYRDILLAGIDTQPKNKIANYVLRRYRDDLYLVVAAEREQLHLQMQEQVPEHTQAQLQDLVPNLATHGQAALKIAWQLDQALKLPNGLTLTKNSVFGSNIVLPAATKTLTVCLGQSKGERAKKVFQTHAIPPWERGKYPLVFMGERLVAVVGLWVSPRLTALPMAIL